MISKIWVSSCTGHGCSIGYANNCVKFSLFLHEDVPEADIKSKLNYGLGSALGERTEKNSDVNRNQYFIA